MADPQPTIEQRRVDVERLRAELAQAERALTLAALQETRGNRTHAARLLGIPLRTLFRHVAALGETAPIAVRPPTKKTA